MSKENCSWDFCYNSLQSRDRGYPKQSPSVLSNFISVSTLCWERTFPDLFRPWSGWNRRISTEWCCAGLMTKSTLYKFFLKFSGVDLVSLKCYYHQAIIVDEMNLKYTLLKFLFSFCLETQADINTMNSFWSCFHIFPSQFCGDVKFLFQWR